MIGTLKKKKNTKLTCLNQVDLPLSTRSNWTASELSVCSSDELYADA